MPGRHPWTGDLSPVASDWDSSMRDAMHHESVEALRHQLEMERQQKAMMERSDYFFSLGVLGFAFGIGYGIGALRPKMPRRKG